MELENRFRLLVITIHSSPKNLSLASMAATCMVDVNASILCLPLEPLYCNKTASMLRVESALVGRSRRFYLVVGTVDFGLTTTAIVSRMPHQVVSPGESCLAVPASVGARNLLEVCDQESVTVVKDPCSAKEYQLGHNWLGTWVKMKSPLSCTS